MPTLGRPVMEGGCGFDYRLAMGIPDQCALAVHFPKRLLTCWLGAPGPAVLWPHEAMALARRSLRARAAQLMAAC